VRLPFLIAGLAIGFAQSPSRPRPIDWRDVAPLHKHLEARGLPAVYFQAEIDRIRGEHAQRVREGDLDHLVFYLLQSTRYTSLPPIEPAISAKGLVDSLAADEREVFLREARAVPSRIPDAVRSRTAALVRAVESPGDDPRLVYFRELVQAAFAPRRDRQEALLREYLRTMRFVYEKEFVAQKSPRPAEEVSRLYRTRGLSTDTAVEAGYLVYLGLGVAKSLEPARRFRRVLIVGPGLDLAPRTALREDSPPESYQPWAVIDALLAVGLSTADDLEVVAADINPRVVNHLRRAKSKAPTLTLASEVRDSPTVKLSEEFREYFGSLGRGIGTTGTLQRTPRAGELLQKTVQVTPAIARILSAESLDIVTERLQGSPFDLVIATNILPYFDDLELMLSMSNVAAMLGPGGVFMHNEPRPLLGEITDALGLRFEQARQATIATVRGAPPLADSVFLHRKSLIPNR
jgi:hypothetical protein